MSVANEPMDRILQQVLEQIPDPSKGLADPVFQFALKITPMINVDLLVRNERGEHLLAWRTDTWGAGWHVPGGIIRFNEPIDARIAAVAESELSAKVRHAPLPVDIKQFFRRRGHFISLLYLCELEEPVRDSALWHQGGHPLNGQLAWHKGTPPDVYSVHREYADWLKGRST